MIARPKRQFVGGSSDSIKVLPSEPGSLFIECEIIEPESQKWRIVVLRVPAEQVAELIKAGLNAATAGA